MNCVDLGESFPTSIYLQKSASIQPRTSPSKFGGNYSTLFNRVLSRAALRRAASSDAGVALSVAVRLPPLADPAASPFAAEVHARFAAVCVAPVLRALHDRPRLAALAVPLRTPVNNIEYFPPNFEGLVLGCIDADFCK